MRLDPITLTFLRPLRSTSDLNRCCTAQRRSREQTLQQPQPSRDDHILPLTCASSPIRKVGLNPTSQPPSPDDHSVSVPPLPFPNRTVKRDRADDSGCTSVKVGHRQALIPQNPTSFACGVLSFWLSIKHQSIWPHPEFPGNSSRWGRPLKSKIKAPTDEKREENLCFMPALL